MNRIYLSLFIFLPGVAGCGDNAGDKVPADGQPMSEGPIAITVAPPPNFMPPGILSKLDVEQLVLQPNLAAGLVGGDPILRRVGDVLYIVNRDLNNITMLDARTLEYKNQVKTGENSNPQDVAVVADKLYIPALGTSGVVVANRDGTGVKTVTLDAASGNDDGKPDCVSAYAIGNDVYVACGLLKQFMPTGNSKLFVIDAITDTVRTSIDLPSQNPVSLFVRSPMNAAFPDGDLIIPTAPDYQARTAGCVLRVTPGATPSTQCLVQNADLGGSVSHLDLLDGPSPLLLLAVAPSETEGQLRVLDVQTKQLWSGAVSPSTQLINDFAACPNGKIVVADNTEPSGLRVYTPAGAEITTAPLPIGLPPGFADQLVCYTP